MSNLSLGQTYLTAQFSSLHRYFIETAATDIHMLLHVQLQFCNNSGFVVTSGVIIVLLTTGRLNIM